MTIDTDVLVVGSGAGGATTAMMLAEAGRRVTVVEEGPWVDPDEVEPFCWRRWSASTATRVRRRRSAPRRWPTPRVAAWGGAPR
ncbi:MAG: FAD-binding protein, partial [Acidimicrobiia bacterium]|nr:FAD-binding protein [Acidimicrobiia bacterium]